MEKSKKEICVLQEADTKKQAAGLIPETILALMMLSGILFSIRDLGYSPECLAVGLAVGIVVILVRQISGQSEKLREKVRMAVFIAGVICFVLSAVWLMQGFLFTVDQVLRLWNARFHTEAELFAVGDTAGTGSVILWGLLALCIASVILTLLKKKSIGGLLGLCIPAFAFGAILGQSSMWGMVILLLPSVLGIFIFYSSPSKRIGLRSGLLLLGLCAVLAVTCLLVSGYRESGSIERWKRRTAEKIEKLRYGEDSLPQGILAKSSGLLEGKKNTLKVTMENPQELYLRGFVGSDYAGRVWQPTDPEKYQGDYEGMLKWLENLGFQPVTQYGEYEHLSEKAAGNSLSNETVQVDNNGAYRKYIYLPAAAYSWSAGDASPKRDWQVQSGRFLGASYYEFHMADAVGTADEVHPAGWLENAQDEEENQYLDAESVYHSFAEDAYFDVDDELKDVIDEMFFADTETMDEMTFTDLTKQIRKVLRVNADYVEKPENPDGQEDAIRWFLTDYKKGNAVYFASAAVMAYRTAGYPARYVEGYHLSANDAQAMADQGETEVQLTTKNAHAWVEVYVAGTGWLPVEVVPGMYVETYSNQRVEGRAAYQVNISSGDNGISTDQGGSEQTGSGNGQSETKEKAHVYRVIGALILILYAAFILYLLLELQRAVRIALRERKGKEKQRDGISADEYVAYAEWLFGIAGVRLESEQMEENWDEIRKKIPGVTREELERPAELVQKERFGGKQLKPYEYHALESLVIRMENALLETGGPMKKLMFRYWWALKKR